MTNGAGQTLYNAWAANGKSPPIAMATQTFQMDMTAVETAPARGALAVRAVPSTAWDSPEVEIALPSAKPARIELFDVSGRRILAQRVGSTGVGEHRVALRPARRLASGVYLVRLVQGSRSASAKLILAR